MTRIDFYSDVPDKIQYACRVVRKARAANQQIVVLANRQHLQLLDDALWTFSEVTFLPHVMAGDPLAASTPIILTASDTVELPHQQILINLSDSTPGNFARFERMLEIISSDETDKAHGRERYRFYLQRGYPLTHHVIDKS